MLKGDVRLFIICATFILVFPWIVGNIHAVSHYVDIMVFAGIFCLVNLGLSLFMGYAGQICLAQAAFFGIGAYSSGMLTAHLGWNPWAAMPVGMIVAAAVAWIVGKPSLRLKGHYLAMATLGFGVIVFIFLNEQVDWTGGPAGLTGIPGLEIAGHEIYSEYEWYYLVWGVVFAVMVFCFHIINSRMGRALRALHEEERAAETVGIPTARYKLMIFMLSASFAALAGSFFTHYTTFLAPTSFDLMWSVRFMLMVMVGGMYSLWGALFGTILMTFAGNEWLHVFADFEILVYGAILLLVALFLPRGLVSLLPGAGMRS